MDPADLTRTYRHYLAAVVRFHLVAAEKGGMGPTDFQASSIIELEGPLTPGDLAQRLGLSRSATTRVIDRLVGAGVADRTTDATDRRRVVVAHSGYVPGAVRELLGAVQGPIVRTVDALTPEQVEGLMTYFRSATEAYRAAIDPAAPGQQDQSHPSQ